MKIKITMLLFFFNIALSYSQNFIKGKVIDAVTKEPLAFSNLQFNKESSFGTATDINGNFSYRNDKPITHISCSHIGYETFSKTISRENGEILIELVASKFELQEVEVTQGENPANALMRKVIANKDLNNPEKISSFKYQSYNKQVYSFKSDGSAKADSILAKQKIKGIHLLMMESVSERKFLSPDISEEVVIATKISGFKNPTFASLATDFQPFSFYQDNIKLFDINYLNPISDGSLKKYKFKIEDTIYQKQDTVYVVSFKPLKNKNFDALKGLLYINTNKYAVQNVIASPFVKGKIDIRIQQQYAFLEDKYWFPEQLNFALIFTQFPTPEVGMILDGKSFIDKVTFDEPLNKKDFALESVRMDENASKKDSVYWNEIRKEKLNAVEERTYTVIDSIGEKHNFDSLLTFAERFGQGRIPVKMIDIDLTKFFVYNKYEGFRLGAGFYTNERLFEKVSLGGFFGYGLKDYDWKYGGEIIYKIQKKNDVVLGAKYQRNLMETGNYGLNSYEPSLVNFRNYIGFQYDRIKQADVYFGQRSFRYFQWKVNLKHTQIEPQYHYQFQNNSQELVDYKDASVSLQLRFAYKEKIVNTMNQNFSMGSDYPILYLSYSKGIKGVFQSDFDYTKLEATVEQSFFTKNLGQSSYRLEAGFIDNPLPYGMLFTGEGSYDKKAQIIMKNTFQTLRPYEFLSDTYANLFLSHNFGGLLFKSGKFQPDVTLHHNMGWGNLSSKNVHHSIVFQTKDKVFTETGLQVDNILKINYLNVGNLGFGFGVYFRYGAYANPEFKDNVVLKFSTSFSIK